jgi:hypothetical protein
MGYFEEEDELTEGGADYPEEEDFEEEEEVDEEEEYRELEVDERGRPVTGRRDYDESDLD